MFLNLLALALLAPCLTFIVLAGIIWQRRKSRPEHTGSLLLALIVLGCAVMTPAYGIEMLVPSLSEKMLALSIRYMGSVILMPAILLFAFWYIGKERWLTPFRIACVCAPCLLVLIAFLTNDLHHLYYPDIWLDTEYEIPQLLHTNGPLYPFSRIIMFGYVGTAALLLIKGILANPWGSGRGGILILIGLLIPLLGQAAYLSGVKPLGFLNLTDYCFTVTAVILTVAVFRYRIQFLRPIAHETLIRRLPDGMIVLDEDLEIIEANPSACTMLGVQERRIIGKSLESVLSPSDPVYEVARIRSPAHVEVARLGGWCEISLTPLADHRNDITGYLLIIRDITSRRRDQDALKESEQQYRQIITHLQDIFIRIDLTGAIQIISPSGVRTLGYDSDADLIGTRVLSHLVVPEELDLLREEILSGVSVQDHEIRIRKRDGEEITVSANLALVRDATGNPLGFEGIIRDVSERKRAADALNLVNRKLGILSSITRHDILNQLTILIGYLEIEQNKVRDTESTRLLNISVRTAWGITDLISFTREYEEIGANTPRWIPMEMLTSRVSDFGSRHGISVIHKCGRYEIYADPLITKVIYNLVDNAIRHGGSVSRIVFGDTIQDDCLIFSCEDNGDGIPDEQKERIFDRNVGKNTGMGLFLVREILSITGIEISETGRSGSGARFEMKIPAGMFRPGEWKEL
ncbi:MAG TPA: histidine kinase N-terminal 7TM domain-containing protein [Methanospirillum sp.]|nr:histidine kinase N-terminal 7TM domain-containing protein [Methanospirillum sp.]